METALNAQPKRTNSYERSIDGARPNLPFSLKLGDTNDTNVLNRPASKMSPLTFNMPQGNNKGHIKSHNPFEIDVTLNRPDKRPSPFFLLSSQHDAPQRRRLDISKSGSMLGLKPDAAMKSEEKLFMSGQGNDMAPENAHTSTYLSSSPPIIGEQAHNSLNIVTYSQQTPVVPGLGLQRHGVSRTESRQRFSSMSFYASHSDKRVDSWSSSQRGRY
jgi:hypothetical protein